MNDVETLRRADLPPAFYCRGTRDGFAGQFTQNANAVEQAGCCVVRKVLQNYPHGYGTGGNPEVWGKDFDRFLTEIMTEDTAIGQIDDECASGEHYRTYGPGSGRRNGIKDDKTYAVTDPEMDR